MKRLSVAVWSLALLAACQALSSPSAPASEPGEALFQLCDPASSAGLEGIASVLDGLDEPTDTAEIEAASTTARVNLQVLELQGEEDEWRAASIDALNQLERRIDDPERLPEVARHAARTLRALEARLCS